MPINRKILGKWVVYGYRMEYYVAITWLMTARPIKTSPKHLYCKKAGIKTIHTKQQQTNKKTNTHYIILL